MAANVRRATSITIAPEAGRVTIVGIGSSSTSGTGASNPATTYPAVLQQLLDQRPEVATFAVFNKGVSGESLPQLQARFQRDVLDLRPQLVVLQTGTIDAIGDQGPATVDAFRQRLRDAVAALKPKVRVVLLNSQYYPGQPASYERFQAVLDEVSGEQDVPIVDRYGLMKFWVTSGQYSFSQILAPDNFHTNDFTYRCTAQIMSELVLARTQAAGTS